MVDPEVLRLVQVTVRTFYEPKFVIVLDQLVRKEAMRDEELAARIGLNTKDLGKLANKLAEDGFLATHRRNELRPGAMKASPRVWYYIDYQRTIDNIKWRIFKINRVVDNKLRNELDTQGYVCPRCKKSFSTLDYNSLYDHFSGQMRCDVCGSEVADNTDTEEVKQTKDKMKRLLAQTDPIVQGLQKAEAVKLNAFDIAAWLEKHAPVAASDLLPIASGSAPAKVTIELVGKEDDEAQKLKKEAEAEAKRTQNALPTWIGRSTITGELTAVGAAHHAGDKDGDSTAKLAEEGLPSPTKTTADDGIDAYYANLAAAQAAALATKKEEEDSQGSPSSSVPANTKLADSGYEEFGDDAFSRAATPASTSISPAVSGQGKQKKKHKKSNSLRLPTAPSAASSLGKRSREPSEDSEVGKRSRTGENTPAAVPEPLPEVETFEDQEEDEAAVDDPILTVKGVEMPYLQITEAMTEQMDGDEYTRYFEHYSMVNAF